MPRAVKQELRRVLPAHTDIYIMYGATEASARLTYLRPDKFEEKIDSIGKAISGVSIRILEKEDREVSPGQGGELVTSGPNIMKGYWKDPQATNQVLNDKGYYHSGDLAYRDEEGYVYIVGRKDNLLKVGGHRINPVEIEDVLMASGQLIEATVLGIPDSLLGYKLVALVAPKNKNCEESKLLNHCAENLPKYKLPGEIRFIPQLPSHPSGKIDREKCLEMLDT